MQDNSEWGTLSWGLGSLQKCIISPMIRNHSDQTHHLDLEGNFCLMNDQPIVVGVSVSPDPNTTQTLDFFCALFEQNFKYLTLGYTIECVFSGAGKQNLLNSGTVTRGSGAGSQQSGGSAIQQASICRTSSGVFISIISPVRVEHRFIGIPLVIHLTLGIELNHGRFISNSGSQMDSEERYVRTLLDVNRFRPTRVPAREIKAGVVISYPASVTVSHTEVSAHASIIRVAVTNNCPNKSIKIVDLAMHLSGTVISPIDDLQSADQPAGGSGEADAISDYSYGDSQEHHHGEGELLPRGILQLSQIHDPFECEAHASDATSGSQVAVPQDGILIEPDSSFSFVFSASTASTGSCIVGQLSTPFSLSYEVLPASSGSEAESSIATATETTSESHSYVWKSTAKWNIGLAFINSSLIPPDDRAAVLRVEHRNVLNRTGHLLISNSSDAIAAGCPISATFHFSTPQPTAHHHAGDTTPSSIPTSQASSAATVTSPPSAEPFGTVGQVLVLSMIVRNLLEKPLRQVRVFLPADGHQTSSLASFIVLDPAVVINHLPGSECKRVDIRVLPTGPGLLRLETLSADVATETSVRRYSFLHPPHIVIMPA